jgi:hypothetical protein
MVIDNMQRWTDRYFYIKVGLLTLLVIANVVLLVNL